MNRAISSAVIIMIIATTLLAFSYRSMNELPNAIDTQPSTNTMANTSDTNTTVVVPPSVIPPTLPAPSGVTATTINSTSVKITWNAVSDDKGSAIVYQVWRNGQKLATVSRTQFLDVFLIPGQHVSYAIVSAIATGAVSSPSAVASATLPTQVATTPSKPTTPTTNKPSTPSTPTTKPSTNANKPATNTNTNPPTTNTSTNTNTPPPPPPPPTTPACGSGGPCTAADVAKHATKSNCWVYLSPINKVYNVTSYVNGSAHPGGNVIAPYCGQNMYAAFIGRSGGHAHSNSALNSVLAAYYIAAFQP